MENEWDQRVDRLIFLKPSFDSAAASTAAWIVG
jgi:hypothetical protein